MILSKLIRCLVMKQIYDYRQNHACVCWACGAEENGHTSHNSFSFHHIVKYRFIQDDTWDNIWILCKRCHGKVEAFTAVEWNLFEEEWLDFMFWKRAEAVVGNVLLESVARRLGRNEEVI